MMKLGSNRRRTHKEVVQQKSEAIQEKLEIELKLARLEAAERKAAEFDKMKEAKDNAENYIGHLQKLGVIDVDEQNVPYVVNQAQITENN